MSQKLQVLSNHLREWMFPLAGSGLLLYANMKMEAVCRCGGASPWFFYLLSTPFARGSAIMALAFGAQIWLSLLIPNHRYVKIAIVLCLVAILIAPDMSLLAENKAHALSAGQWRAASPGREMRTALLGFLALFINLTTALYRSNAYILSKI